MIPAICALADTPDDVTVGITAADGEYRVAAEPIREHLPDGRIPIRLGIELTNPVTKAEIKVIIVPSR